MNRIVELITPNRNERLVEELKKMVAQAESGEMTGLVGVRLRHDSTFGTVRIGACSDLELCGALTFALFDTIDGNPGRQDIGKPR